MKVVPGREEINMPSKRVLSVGQCGADHGSISWTLQRAFGAEVVPAATAASARALLVRGGFDLVLVNRVFDADGDGGLAFVRDLKADPTLTALPVMLVSNYSDAQDEAVQAGALPGFGKAALGAPEMLGRVAPYLGAADGAGGHGPARRVSEPREEPLSSTSTRTPGGRAARSAATSSFSHGACRMGSPGLS
jgi:two-component system chemotaxis response regulator CheY